MIKFCVAVMNSVPNRQLFSPKDGCMPKRIVREMYDLKDENDPRFIHAEIPTTIQISYIVRRHNEANNEHFIRLGDLVKWLESKKTFPVDDDESYVVDYNRSRPGEKAWFRFAITTPRLLRYCVGLKKLSIDATYKLNWNGFPLIIIGTTDMMKRFHPLMFVCVTYETTKDYEFAFQAMKNAVENEYGSHVSEASFYGRFHRSAMQIGRRFIERLQEEYSNNGNRT